MKVNMSMEPWAAEKKKRRLMWRWHQLLFGFLAKGHLLRVSRKSRKSRKSRLSAYDKGDNEISRTVNRSPGVHLTAKENYFIQDNVDQSSPQMVALPSK